jgi:hypothetical protein
MCTWRRTFLLMLAMGEGFSDLVVGAQRDYVEQRSHEQLRRDLQNLHQQLRQCLGVDQQMHEPRQGLPRVP